MVRFSSQLFLGTIPRSKNKSYRRWFLGVREEVIFPAASQRRSVSRVTPSSAAAFPIEIFMAQNLDKISRNVQKNPDFIEQLLALYISKSLSDIVWKGALLPMLRPKLTERVVVDPVPEDQRDLLKSQKQECTSLFPSQSGCVRQKI